MQIIFPKGIGGCRGLRVQEAVCDQDRSFAMLIGRVEAVDGKVSHVEADTCGKIFPDLNFHVFTGGAGNGSR